MTDRYLVRCTATSGRAMAGLYAASVTATKFVATWQQERAARYESKYAAAGDASRLKRRFSGTAWEVCRAD